MPRIFIHLDERSVLKLAPVLHINGQELQLTERELDALLNEILWAKDTISAARGAYYSNLAAKYQEVARS